MSKPLPASSRGKRALEKELPSFPLEALPPAFRDYIADCAFRMNADPAMVGLPLLAAAGSVIGNSCAIKPQQHDDWSEFPNIWCAVIAPSGALKSPTLQAALKFVKELQGAEIAAFAQVKADYERAKTTHAAELDAWKAAKKKGETALEPPQPPEEPRPRRYLSQDSTYEALGLHLQNSTCMLVEKDELGSFIRSLSDDRRGGERGFYLSSWSGGPYTFDRIGRGTIHLSNALTSVVGGIQPQVLASLVSALGTIDKINDGFLQRFSLLAGCRRVDYDPGSDRPPDITAEERARAAFLRLSGLRADATLYLRFSTDAQAEFTQWRSAFEGYLVSQQNPALMAQLSKLRKLLPALSLIDHVCENDEPVGLASLQRAIALTRYCTRMALHVYQDDAKLEKARALSQRLSSLKSTFTIRDITRSELAGLSTVGEARDAVQVLVAHGWVQATEKEDTFIKGT